MPDPTPQPPSSGDYSSATFEQAVLAVAGEGVDLHAQLDTGGQAGGGDTWFKLAAQPSEQNTLWFKVDNQVVWGMDLNVSASDNWLTLVNAENDAVEAMASGKTGLMDVYRLNDASDSVRHYDEWLTMAGANLDGWAENIGTSGSAFKGKAAEVVRNNVQQLSLTVNDLHNQLNDPSVSAALSDAAASLLKFGNDTANAWHEHYAFLTQGFSMAQTSLINNIRGFLDRIQQQMAATAQDGAQPGDGGAGAADNEAQGRSLLAGYDSSSGGPALPAGFRPLSGDLGSQAFWDEANAAMSDYVRTELTKLDTAAQASLATLGNAYEQSGQAVGEMGSDAPSAPGSAATGASGLTNSVPGSGTTGLSGQNPAGLSAPGGDASGLTTPNTTAPDGGASGLTNPGLAGSGGGASGLTTSDLAGSAGGASGLTASGGGASGLTAPDPAGTGAGASGFAFPPVAAPAALGGLTTPDGANRSGTGGAVSPALTAGGGGASGLSTPDQTAPEDDGWVPPEAGDDDTPITVPSVTAPFSGGGPVVGFGPGASAGAGPISAIAGSTAGGGSGPTGASSIGAPNDPFGTGGPNGWSDWSQNAFTQPSTSAAGQSDASSEGSPFFPPMMGSLGGMGGGQQERERRAFVPSDKKVWGADARVGSGVLGRPDGGDLEADEPPAPTHVHVRLTVQRGRSAAAAANAQTVVAESPDSNTSGTTPTGSTSTA